MNNVIKKIIFVSLSFVFGGLTTVMAGEHDYQVQNMSGTNAEIIGAKTSQGSISFKINGVPPAGFPIAIKPGVPVDVNTNNRSYHFGDICATHSQGNFDIKVTDETGEHNCNVYYNLQCNPGGSEDNSVTVTGESCHHDGHTIIV